jgi:flagellar biosynthesis protein FlhA
MRLLEVLQQKGEIIIAIGIVSLLGVMLIPMPPYLLDLLLAFSISLAVLILINSVYVKKPLDFSVFPSLLLIATLYRLALNVASTKLILLKGHEGTDAAGTVIRSFGNFVVGGNYLVGFIIFIILVIVNFVVITKGAGRIAEVAARFTLDAMPGKQMSIDADLNAGIIDEAEARRRRKEISREADFYGAMDGASKFVRGDAIAGLIITGINIVGGLLIGVIQRGMAISDAASTFTILTVGDGLVSQIPALLISTAAGIVISRSGSDVDMGKEMTKQVLINPKVLMTTSAILLVFGLIPGLPHIPILVMSIFAGSLGYILSKSQEEVQEEVTQEGIPEEAKIESFVEIEPLTLEIGYGLIPLVEQPKAELLHKIKAMRRQIAKDMGFVVPSIHIKDNLQLRPQEYRFLIRGIEIAKYEVVMGHMLAVRADGAEKIDGIPTKEPAFGLPAYWIDEKDVEKAQALGYMVVDVASVIATHITELIKHHSWEILTRTEVQNLLDEVSKLYPKIVDELIPVHMTLGGVQRVLQNLLKERVPINDLVTILETLLDYAPTIKDPDALTEHVRQALSRYITKQYTTDEGNLYVITIDPRLERSILQTIEAGEALNPDLVNKMIKNIEKLSEEFILKGVQPVILCSIHTRRYLKRILEKFSPSIVVLSNAEISSSAKLYTLGMVKYED